MRVLQIGREMMRTSCRYSMPSMLMFVLPTLFDSHPATVEQLSKEREKFSVPSPFCPAASLLIASTAPLFRPIRQTRRTSSPSDGRCRFT